LAVNNNNNNNNNNNKYNNNNYYNYNYYYYSTANPGGLTNGKATAAILCQYSNQVLPAEKLRLLPLT
jgi:hypothetical protein